MAFVQFKLDRSIDQSRGIFNKYIYETSDDTIANVLASDYFAASRFITIDGPDTNSEGWVGGLVECKCSDGYFLGEVQADGSTLIDLTSGGGSSSENIIIVTSDYNQTVDDDILLVTGTTTITLLPIASADKSIMIKNDGVNVVTLAPDGSETVEITSLSTGQSVGLAPGGDSFSWVGI